LLTITNAGAATFISSITAQQGIFSLPTIGGAIASVRNLNVLNTNGAVGDWAGINFSYYNSGTNFGYIGTIVTSDATNSLADLVFGVKASSATTSVTEYMRIKGGGNVVFAGNLSVTSSANSLFTANNGTLSNNILTVKGGGGTGAFGFRVEANNGEAIFYTDNLSYNIFSNPIGGSTIIGGTVSGGGKLQVNGNVNINGVFQINGVTIGGGGGSGVTGSGTNGTITKWTGGTTLGNSIIKENGNEIQINSSATQGYLRLGGGNGAGNSRIFIESNGNNSYIDNYGDNTYKDLEIAVSNLTIRNGGAINSVFNANGALYIGNATNDGKRLVVINNNTTVYNPNSYNGTNGAVTIGTGNATGAYSTIRFCGGGSHEAFFGSVQTAGGLGDFIWQSYNGSNYGEIMRINSSTRNLLIGTSTDAGYKLQVTGAIYASNDVIAFSDISVKKNIRNIENALERVVKSRGVLYDRKDIDSKNNIGFIAQELELEFPEIGRASCRERV
jgi:hypothetical protein